MMVQLRFSDYYYAHESFEILRVRKPSILCFDSSKFACNRATKSALVADDFGCFSGDKVALTNAIRDVLLPESFVEETSPQASAKLWSSSMPVSDKAGVNEVLFFLGVFGEVDVDDMFIDASLFSSFDEIISCAGKLAWDS